PGLVNSSIDKTDCFDTSSLKESPWNQHLIHRIAEHCEYLVSVCPDKARFGQEQEPIKWHELIRDRFYRLFLAITKAQPLYTGDTDSNIVQRLLSAHNRRKKMTNATTSRH
ncbi:hypothetical protein EV360DRAFT_18224, partial [Lentinula raphanica]